MSKPKDIKGKTVQPGDIVVLYGDDYYAGSLGVVLREFPEEHPDGRVWLETGGNIHCPHTPYSSNVEVIDHDDELLQQILDEKEKTEAIDHEKRRAKVEDVFPACWFKAQRLQVAGVEGTKVDVRLGHDGSYVTVSPLRTALNIVIRGSGVYEALGLTALIFRRLGFAIGRIENAEEHIDRDSVYEILLDRDTEFFRQMVEAQYDPHGGKYNHA